MDLHVLAVKNIYIIGEFRATVYKVTWNMKNKSTNQVQKMILKESIEHFDNVFCL